MISKKILNTLLFTLIVTHSILLNAEDETTKDLSTSIKVEGEPEIYMAPGLKPNKALREEEKLEVLDDKEVTQKMLADNNSHVPLEDSIDIVTFKLLRGVTNIATGWLEIPRQLYLCARKDNILLILPLGLSRGIALTVARTLVGVSETALFFYSLDGTFGPVMNPTFVWEKEAKKMRTIYPPTK